MAHFFKKKTVEKMRIGKKRPGTMIYYLFTYQGGIGVVGKRTYKHGLYFSFLCVHEKE